MTTGRIEIFCHCYFRLFVPFCGRLADFHGANGVDAHVEV
jgi:hypothetical protein